MHDQKLAEDQGRIIGYAEESRTPIDWNAVHEYMDKNRQQMLDRFKENSQRYVFGTGSEPKTDNGRWMYDDHEFPQRSFTPEEEVIRSYVGKKWTGFQKWQWLMQGVGKHPRTIDHPYLLPPASDNWCYVNHGKLTYRTMMMGDTMFHLIPVTGWD